MAKRIFRTMDEEKAKDFFEKKKAESDNYLLARDTEGYSVESGMVREVFAVYELDEEESE